MIDDVLSTLAKLTRNGQMSLPSELRRRWNVDAVMVMDYGDYAVIAPLPANPIEHLRGSLAGRPGPSGDEMRDEDRRVEAEIEERREAARAEFHARRRAEGEAGE